MCLRSRFGDTPARRSMAAGAGSWTARLVVFERPGRLDPLISFYWRTLPRSER